MFITQSSVIAIVVCYLLLLIIFSLLILNNHAISSDGKLIRILILFLLPILGMIIIAIDFTVTKKFKNSKRISRSGVKPMIEEN